MQNFNSRHSPNRNSSSSTFLILLLTLLLLVSAGLSFYLFTTLRECLRSEDNKEEAENIELPVASGLEWEETNLMGAYSFKYPEGWHVAMLWNEETYGTVTVAVNPTPVNTAPRGGPLAEISFTDTSGLEDPDGYLQNRLDAAKDFFMSSDMVVIPTSFGEIYQLKGMISVYDEEEYTEKYIFKIYGSLKNNINAHVIEITDNPFSDTYDHLLGDFALSFISITE